MCVVTWLDCYCNLCSHRHHGHAGPDLESLNGRLDAPRPSHMQAVQCATVSDGSGESYYKSTPDALSST
eukprot:8680940-Pyramimonas_sp.AAC.1